MQYTQQQVAEFLRISQPAYVKYENGATEVSMENLQRLAGLYGVSELAISVLYMDYQEWQ